MTQERNRRWISNGLRTSPSTITHEEVEILRNAVTDLYLSAGLTPPTRDKILVVPSPFTAALAAGFAVHLLDGKVDGSTHDAIYRAANRRIIEDTTDDEHDQDVYNSVYCPVSDIVSNGVESPTNRAICSTITVSMGDQPEYPVEGGIGLSTFEFVNDALMTLCGIKAKASNNLSLRAYADAIGVGRDGLACAKESWLMMDGGNLWAGLLARQAYYRDVLRVPHPDWGKYAAWETAAIHGGPKYLHRQFAIISDFPTRLSLDDDGCPAPWGEGGTYCEWRDGSKLWCV